MLAYVRLQSKKIGELNSFLSKFYNTNMDIKTQTKWKHSYENPIEITDLIGVYVDNFDKYNIKMWINLDKDIYIKISEENANAIIRYIFERYPY